MPQRRRTAKSRSQPARLQFKTRICWRKRAFNWTCAIQRYGNAFVFDDRTVSGEFQFVCKNSTPRVIFFTKTSTSHRLYSSIWNCHHYLFSLSSLGTRTPHSKDVNQFYSFAGEKKLVSTMKISVLLVFLFVLPLVVAQVPHWGPCPEPEVQPEFSLKEVEAPCECAEHHSMLLHLQSA